MAVALRLAFGEGGRRRDAVVAVAVATTHARRVRAQFFASVFSFSPAELPPRSVDLPSRPIWLPPRPLRPFPATIFAGGSSGCSIYARLLASGASI
jgi:hypothetical protein